MPETFKKLDSPIWIHAVSVGEAAVASKLARKLKENFPGAQIVVSTTTKTGNSMIKKNADFLDGVFYFPLDFSFVVEKVVRIIKPRCFCMIETELWPNLLMTLHKNNVPVVLVNGRISDSSYRNYLRIKWFFGRIFNSIDLCLMQSEVDAERIKALGAKRRIAVTGNIKFDELDDVFGKKVFTKESFGFSHDDTVIVAGSTHNPEEKMVITLFKNLKKRHKNLKLIVAPRHVERTGEIKSYLEKEKIKHLLLTEILNGQFSGFDSADAVLVDTIGDLKYIYNASSIIFVGGSMVKKGGQNPIEGARWGKPVIFGPFMFNFRAISNIFLAAGAAIQINSESELKAVLEDLIVNPEKRESLSKKAIGVIDSNRGAILKTVENIKKYVD